MTPAVTAHGVAKNFIMDGGSGGDGFECRNSSGR
jgi:hypothetical protein